MTHLADKFAARLLEMGKKVRPAGDGKFEAQCPSHDDRAASLSIGTGEDGRLLLHCHAGCLVDRVIADAKWPLADCFPPKAASISPRNGQAPKAVKVWPTLQGAAEAARWGIDRQWQEELADAKRTLVDGNAPAKVRTAAERTLAKRGEVLYSAHWLYLDAHGGEFAAVARFDLPTVPTEKQEKTFRPFHRVAAGWAVRPFHRVAAGWAAGDPVGKWPLYRLPELMAALQRGEGRVYLVEGEKACDAAAACGLVVTTSAHGSQSPGKTDWTPLAGATEIVILPDADLPNPKTGRIAGEEYAQQAAAQIMAVR